MKHLLAAALLLIMSGVGQADETRAFVDGLGRDVTIPAAPTRIVSLRGEQFTAPLMELGAPIVGSTADVISGVNNGEPVIRGAYDLFNARFANTGIAFVGTSRQPDVEAIAVLKPDLILVPDFASENVAQLSAIAPTVVINIWSNKARDRYRRIAEAAGLLDEFERLEKIYDFRVGEARNLIATMIGDPSAVSVAIAEVRGKRFRAYKNYGAMSDVLNDLGFGRPALIENISGDRLDLSPEQIEAIDADFLVSSYSDNFNQPPSELRANWDNLIPGWDQVLHAPRNNQHILISREPMRALSFRSMEEILAIYVSNIVTRRFVPLGSD